jgi:hypothetical protein
MFEPFTGIDPRGAQINRVDIQRPCRVDSSKTIGFDGDGGVAPGTNFDPQCVLFVVADPERFQRGIGVK